MTALIMPRKIADKIKCEGRREAEKSREASGVLFGQYKTENNSIFVSRMSTLPSKIGTDLSEEEDIRNFKLHFPKILYVSCKVYLHYYRAKSTGAHSARVSYHTHPWSSSWSEEDIESLQNLVSIEHLLPGLKGASLLYIVGTDEFAALDSAGNSMPVQI